MNKKERLHLICDLVSRYQIDTQEEIVSRLQKAGVSATQATVSRDIKSLGIIKIPAANNSYVYGLPKAKAPRQASQSGYLRRAAIQDQMIHLDVEPGSTALIKRRLLERFSQQIFSVVSDDDSLLIIVKADQDAEAFAENLKEW